MVKLTILVPPEMLAQLNALTEKRQKASRFVPVERSAVCREVLAVGLEHLAPQTPKRPSRKDS
jgi:hypothetical protein